MDTKDIHKAHGHWILAKMGKKVLRPGGKELTKKLIDALHFNNSDNVVEFAPGMGFTASLTLAHKLHSYVGVDADEDIVRMLSKKFQSSQASFILGNASQTNLESESKDKVYGEAMLTMHADHRKSEIIREAHRILKKGGWYAIHELGLTDVDETLKSKIQRDLALSIKVNARPLTEVEWKHLLEQEGFAVKKVMTNGMHLLEMNRIIDDEGILRATKIGWNILTHPKARKRILEMRKVFKQYQNHMNAIAIVAEKL